MEFSDAALGGDESNPGGLLGALVGEHAIVGSSNPGGGSALRRGMPSGRERRPGDREMELFDCAAHVADDGSGSDDLGGETFGEE